MDDVEHGHRKLRPESRNTGRGECWRSAPFRPSFVQCQVEDNDKLKDKRTGWQPLDYVEQYIYSKLMKLMADCTNVMSVGNSGRSVNTSVDELYHLFDASILMSCVPYPQFKMFWSNTLQIPTISDKMSRDRFFKLRNNLKIVLDYENSHCWHTSVL